MRLSLVMFLAAAVVYAGEAALEPHQVHAEAGLSAYAKAQFGVAESEFLLALKEAETLERAEFLVADLTNLAAAKRAQAQYGAAEGLYLRAIETGSAKLGMSHSTLALAHGGYGLLCSSTGRFEEAEAHYRGAIKILEAATPRPDVSLASVLNNFGELRRLQHRYEEAGGFFQKARELSHDPRQIVIETLNLGAVAKAQGRYAEAEKLNREGLNQAQALQGSRHPEVATALNNLGQVYAAQRKWKAAEPLLREAMEIWRERLGPLHPTYGQALVNLSAIYAEQKKFGLAEEVLREALRVHENALQAGHPAIVNDLNNLAVMMQQQGRWSEAEQTYRRASDAGGSVEVLSNLASLYLAQKRDYEALQCYRQMIAALNAAPVSGSFALAGSLDHYAQLLRRQHEPAQAELVAMRAMQARVKAALRAE